MRSQISQIAILAALWMAPASADVVFFSTGNPDGKMAAASRPDTSGKFEIESGDDFVLTSGTSVSGASFTGLLTGNESVGQVRVEIYRVFPLDSDVTRTSGAPTFSTAQVPTRVNSPSDVAFDDRDSAAPSLTFSTTVLSTSFTSSNSVQPGGIHPAPGETTGGNGPLTGAEVQFDVKFATPFDLSAGHYFFVPQVEVKDPTGNFYWLSAPRPIVSPGTPFPVGNTDLQAWSRDAGLDPDWLRIGTDIVGGQPAPTFNMAFSLTGESVPEPSSIVLLVSGFLTIAGISRKRSSLR
jgi:hypothetical protein